MKMKNLRVEKLEKDIENLEERIKNYPKWRMNRKYWMKNYRMEIDIKNEMIEWILKK
jgi:hypothetical protein